MELDDRPEEAYQRGETGEFQRVDLRTRDRVSQIQGRWEGAMARMWIAIVGLYLVALLGGFILWHQRNQIQASRERATYETCQESNDRHDRTVVAFKREFEAAKKRADPARRRDLEQARAANLRLIDVFIPVHKDSAGRSTCHEFARGRVNVDG